MVLGADTTVVVEGDILGKPANDAEAGAMLRRLSGRGHQVLTGVCLRRGERCLAGVETTEVWFDPLREAEIAAYVASGEPRDKAGAYAIQGRAARFIPRINGSYSNVVGLPLATVWRLWRALEMSGGMVSPAAAPPRARRDTWRIAEMTCMATAWEAGSSKF